MNLLCERERVCVGVCMSVCWVDTSELLDDIHVTQQIRNAMFHREKQQSCCKVIHIAIILQYILQYMHPTPHHLQI